MWPFKRKPNVTVFDDIRLSEYKPRFRFTEYTPDLMNIDQKAWNLLFVWCDLKRGECRNDLLLENTLYDKPFEAFTSQKKFQMFICGGKPVVLTGPNAHSFASNGFGPVKGELYVVSTNALIELDNLRLNGDMYDRKRLYVDIPYASGFVKEDGSGLFRERTGHEEVWMYVGRHDFWERERYDGRYFKAYSRVNGFYNYRS